MPTRGVRGVRLDPKHQARTRAKIQTSQIINRLTDHVLGKVEMKPSQVTAALGLLKKSLPDLTAADNRSLVRHEIVNLSDAELADIAAHGGTRDPEKESRPGEPDSLH